MSIIKLKNNALDNLTSFEGSASLGDMVLVSSATASASATIDFTSGIDSTYKEYIFYFVNIHPATDAAYFTFQANAVGGSGFNETMTTTQFRTQHNEADTVASLDYQTASDQAQGTSYQHISRPLGSDNDQSMSGYLHLFNPSSTTYVKHFIANTNVYIHVDYSQNAYTAGYFNTTSAIDQISFKMSSGNIDDGKILCFGLN